MVRHSLRPRLPVDSDLGRGSLAPRAEAPTCLRLPAGPSSPCAPSRASRGGVDHADARSDTGVALGALDERSSAGLHRCGPGGRRRPVGTSHTAPRLHRRPERRRVRVASDLPTSAALGRGRGAGVLDRRGRPARLHDRRGLRRCAPPRGRPARLQREPSLRLLAAALAQRRRVRDREGSRGAGLVVGARGRPRAAPAPPRPPDVDKQDFVSRS